MNIEIVNQPLTIDIYGFGETAANKEYAGTAFKLMDRMWQVVKGNKLANKGLNIWVYEKNDAVFAGVELNDTPGPEFSLEHKTITLTHYARHLHIGPYSLIKQAMQNMSEELKHKGLNTTLPYVEMYGHWVEDERKLETELVVGVR